MVVGADHTPPEGRCNLGPFRHIYHIHVNLAAPVRHQPLDDRHLLQLARGAGGTGKGDFDPERSDIDFVVVTADELSDEIVSALEAMHARLAASGLKWARKLEGSYLREHGVIVAGPALHPMIDLVQPDDLRGAPCWGSCASGGRRCSITPILFR